MNKQEIESIIEERNKYYNQANSWQYLEFFAGMILTIIIVDVLLWVSPIADNDNLNKDSIARSYILKYYPEFNNCTIKYKTDIFSDNSFIKKTEGVWIFCRNKENRDSLRIVNAQEMEKNNPDYRIKFENMTINDIIKNIIENNELN